MKYIDEYRDKQLVEILLKKIDEAVTKPWTIMEICGGQTHSIMKYNLQELLPSKINLVHGPGCPVCVTPIELIDKAIALAKQNDVILTSFGDMLRVPGSDLDLLSVKASGADIRIVYSPLDCLKIAKENPDKKVVFFAVGFETTAPAIAMAVNQAKNNNVSNFFILASHVLVPPAIEAVLSAKNNKIQGFLAAGHVCTIMGYHEYIPISEKYKTPIVVTGFEPVDILTGVLKLVESLENGETEVQNAYSRSVTKEGNVPAQKLLEKVFKRIDRKWRGIGLIPQSGLELNQNYLEFNAELAFELKVSSKNESKLCSAGAVLTGNLKPNECSAFGKECTPEKPIGAPMVSSEGACAAYYRYNRN